jgi:anti-sigma factor RsiW
VGNKSFKKRKTIEPSQSCKSVTTLIGDYLSGTLDPRLRGSFEAHLANCPDCSAFLKTYKRTIEATRAFLKLQALQSGPPKLTLRARGSAATAR